MYLPTLPRTGSSATTPRSRRPIRPLHALTSYPPLRPERNSTGNAPASLPSHRRRTRRTVPAVEMIDLCKHFGTLRAVDHLSLCVEPGEIFGLLGPNGSGKTTIINMLSGLSVPTSGQVHVLGYDVRRNARQVRHLLGAVPQETALKDARVNTFSGGMKRRLAIGRALLHNPQLMYLDEPTLGVDVQARWAIWDYLLTLREQGKTVLLTTNYLEEAQALCDRLAILDHGQLIAVDTPAHLRQVYGARVIELETSTMSMAIKELRKVAGVKEVRQKGVRLKITTEGTDNLLPRLINIVSRDGPLRDITVREPTLDDIFLRLTGTSLRD